MARAKNSVATKRRRKKILKQAKGYYGHKHIGFRTAKEQVRKSLEYSFRDRKQVKREFRKLWIKRINAASRQHDLSYSRLIHGLNLANVTVNRKMLADVALNHPVEFKQFIDIAKEAIENKPVVDNTATNN